MERAKVKWEMSAQHIPVVYAVDDEVRAVLLSHENVAAQLEKPVDGLRNRQILDRPSATLADPRPLGFAPFNDRGRPVGAMGPRSIRPVTSTAAADQRERMGSLLCRMNERCKREP